MPRDMASNSRKKRSSPRKSGPAPLYAAVDLGTNNCRLLVAEPRGKTFRVVASHSQIARLGEGLNATGALSDASVERALDALKAIRKKLKERGVGRVRCIATEACRRASNGEAFIRRVQDETGLTFKIINPLEEARLALLSCHNLFDGEGDRALILDIGGGSTELALVDAEAARKRGINGMIRKAPILEWGSLPLGVVTLAEAFSHIENEDEAYAAMLAHAEATFREWKGAERSKEELSGGRGYVIGTSGTVTCLAALHQDLDRYRRDKVDGTWLDRADAYTAIHRLIDAGLEGRAQFPTIGPERAGLMLSGCAIMQAAMDIFDTPKIRVADRGLREGLLLSMMYGPKKKPRRRKKKRAAAPEAANG